MSRRPPLAAFVEGVQAGDRGWLARALTLVESRRADDRQLARALMREVLAASGYAFRIGLTGVPGVGKSTLIERLGFDLCEAGHKVAVLAIDPSSQRSGGSILGDKTRMNRLANHPRAYVRPSPSGGVWGGVARATRQSILLCEAAGYDVIVIETVGVGQSETLVAQMVDCFILLLLANAGDELQGIKRGIVELADIVVITKADSEVRLQCELAAAEYRRALSLMQPPHPQWRVPVLLCSAQDGSGVDEIWTAALAFRNLRQGDASLQQARIEQDVQWMWRAVQDEVMSRLRGDLNLESLTLSLEVAVRQGTVHPEDAAQQLVAALSAASIDRSG